MKKRKMAKAPTGAMIRAARTAAQLTQEEAAGVCMVSLRTWRNWEAAAVDMHPVFWAWFVSAARVPAIEEKPVT